MRAKPLDLTGWGRTHVARMDALRPERQSEVAAALAANAPLIARGSGRAYGDAAIRTGGQALLTERLDRILEFDPATNIVVTEPGVTFAQLARTFLPRGLMPPTSPGTAFATVGGAVATDVHGKNHDRHGSFGDHVQWIELLTADGAARRISPAHDPELFAATIGGMGLTGIMTRVCFPLLPGASTHVAVREQRMIDLDAFLDGFARIRDNTLFSVGWIDVMARGFGFARGILETAEFAPPARLKRPGRAKRVPFDLPGFALNRYTVRAFNELWYYRVPGAGRDSVKSWFEFMYPLDMIADWNRIYGKAGFYQFQCVLPDVEAPRGLVRLIEAIGSAAKCASFLAVLKTLGGEGRGCLSFPLRGFTLALDFPRKSGVEEMIRDLETITRDHGGRIYLAKDALLSPESLRAMYPRVNEFETVLARVDPHGRFASDQALRLKLKPGGTAP